MSNLNIIAKFVISTKEKSLQETLQRLDFDGGATCEDFSFVEMTIIGWIGLSKKKNNFNSSRNLTKSRTFENKSQNT
jgi:hypothetical protein